MKKLKIDKPEISSNYSRISNNIWIDPNITPSQLKLLGFLLSQKNGFELNIYFISKCFKRDSMRIKSDLNKLIEYGVVILDNNNNLSFNKDILDGKITTKCSKKITTNCSKNNEEITTNCSKTEKHDETLVRYGNSAPEITTNCSINNTIAPEILDILKEKEINKEKEKTETQASSFQNIIDVQKNEFEKEHQNINASNKNEFEKEHQNINASNKNEFEKEHQNSGPYPGEIDEIPTKEVSLISGTYRSPDNKLDSLVIEVCSTKKELYSSIFKSYLKEVDLEYIKYEKYESYIIAKMIKSERNDLKIYLEEHFKDLVYECSELKYFNNYKLEITNESYV